jgi:hypothetical protein
LPCKDPAAKEILTLIGKYSSSKEVVMAVQEAVERLETCLNEDDEDEKSDAKILSLPLQLIIVVELYASCRFPFVTLKLANRYICFQLYLVLGSAERHP